MIVEKMCAFMLLFCMGSVAFLPHSLFDEKVRVLAPKDCMNNYIGNINKLKRIQ